MANLNSFVFDYFCRQKVIGTGLGAGVLEQLPILRPDAYETMNGWAIGSGSEWIEARTLELTFTAWDLRAFARDLDWSGSPFRWDRKRRLLLRCELDAAFFHLYGINRDDTAYILDTFPIVRRKDVAEHGDYRTKLVILEIFDALQAAIRFGVPYETRLEPPPADLRVAHPPKRVGKA